MLTEAYKSIGEQLDGKVLRSEKVKWAEHMLHTKFPNRMFEFAVMLDCWRNIWPVAIQKRRIFRYCRGICSRNEDCQPVLGEEVWGPKKHAYND